MQGQIDLLSPPLHPFARRAHLFDSFFTCHPGQEELCSWVLRNFTGRGIPKSRPLAPIHVEVVVSQRQAGDGGVVQLQIPLPHLCPLCQGSGQTGFYTCDACEGQGTNWQPRQIDVLIPPGTRQDATIPVSLRSLGLNNLYLNVLVRIGQMD